MTPALDTLRKSVLRGSALANMVKNPRGYPAWVLRLALEELTDRRAAAQKAAAAPPEVLIMVNEDPDTVLLVCPRPECLAENEICELATGVQWNELTWYADTDEVGAAVHKGVDFHRSGFACRNCRWNVSVPSWLTIVGYD
ncbi:hypothetical protein ACXJJ3_42240 (plasmid) [Kribbella sp. WER1]